MSDYRAGAAGSLPLLSPLGAVASAMGGAPRVPAALAGLVRDGALDETGVFLAVTLARLASDLDPADRARLATTIGGLLAAQGAGSTRVAVDDPTRELLVRARPLVGVVDGRVAPPTPLVLEGEYLYTQRTHAAEGRVVARLTARFAARPFAPAALRHAVEQAAATTEPAPSAEQKAAVMAALGRGLGVISGGPGTGKTTTALLLVRSLARLGIAPAGIALCAPTGKAKSRLEEDFRARLGRLPDAAAVDRELAASCPEAQTLHHLLGATGGAGGFRRGARDPLPYRAVVVDESSMVDLVLMDRLLDALPESALLILLGDADQLPSVSTGAVFRDLGPLSSRLERGFRADPARRAGAELVALAEAVRAGDAEQARARCHSRAGIADLCRQGAERLDGALRGELLRQHHARLGDAPALRWLREHTLVVDGDGFGDEASARLAAALGELGRERVLAVTRQGPAGVEVGNAFLHELAGGGPGILPGEPVLVLRNDYRRELWNGDQGVGVRLRRPDGRVEIGCAFPSRRGWVAVDPRAMAAALDLGYVLTVHKAQGSECDEVLFLLPDHAGPLLTRELVYTAISRARTSVVVCGDGELLAAAVRTRQARSSGIADRLTRSAAALDLQATVR